MKSATTTTPPRSPRTPRTSRSSLSSSRSSTPSSPPPSSPLALPVDLEVSLASFLGKTTSKPRYVHPYFWDEGHLQALLIDADYLASKMSPIAPPVLSNSRYRRSPPRSPVSRILLSPLAKSIRQHYSFDAFDHGRLSGIKKCLELMATTATTEKMLAHQNPSSVLFGLKLNPDLSAMFKTNNKSLTAEFPASASNALTRVVSDMFLRGTNEDHFEFGGSNVLPKDLRVTRTFTSANGAARVQFFYGDVVKELPVDAVMSVRPRRQKLIDEEDVDNVVDRRIEAAKDEEAGNDDDDSTSVKFRYAAVIDGYRHNARYRSYGTSKRGWSILRRIKATGEEFADIDDIEEDGGKGGKRQLKPYYFAVLIALAQQQWMEQPTFEKYTAHVLVPSVPLGVTVITATFSNAYLSILLGGGERDECRGDALPAPSTVQIKVRQFSMDPTEAGRRGGFFDCLAEMTSEAVKRTVECLEEQEIDAARAQAPPPPPPPLVVKKEIEVKTAVLKETRANHKRSKSESKPRSPPDAKRNSMPPMGWYYPGSDKENEPVYKLSPSTTPSKDAKALRPRSQSNIGNISTTSPPKKPTNSPKKLRSKQGLLQRPRSSSSNKPHQQKKPPPPLPQPASKIPILKRKALDEISNDMNHNGISMNPTKKLCQMMPT